MDKELFADGGKAFKNISLPKEGEGAIDILANEAIKNYLKRDRKIEPLTDKDKEQIKELCDRAILSFMSIDQVINHLENNRWSHFTIAEGDFIVNIELLNNKEVQDEN